MGAIKEAPKVKWRKPQYRKRVEQFLRDYLPLKESLQDREMVDLFPSCVPVYGEEGIGGGNGSSSTERYALKRVERQSWEKQIFVQRMEKALQTLSQDEWEVIAETYFYGLCAVQVCIQLKMSERSYRRIKARAIEKLAMALGLI
jgi:RinA family phage transcriptional activator